MKAILTAAFLIVATSVSAQKKEASKSLPDPAKKILLVEAACGQCKFKLPGNDCDLAIRIEDKAYYVDGTHIDQHGDAHAKDGFCNAIRKAEVQGEVINDRFKSSYFKVLPATSKN